MKNRFLKCVLLVAFLIFSTLIIRKYFFKSWVPYYQERLYKEPRPLLIKALEFLNTLANKEKNALDLGAGAGNETVFLLKNGWHVWASDIEQEALKIITSRQDVQPYQNNLTLIHSSFIDLPWQKFPQFNLIYAGYSLPFAHSNEFMKIWEHIVNHLQAEGIFAGNFFGPDHSGFNWWLKRNMTFFTKEQLIALFDNFYIELFEEYHEKDKNNEWNHSFNVIAKKLCVI